MKLSSFDATVADLQADAIVVGIHTDQVFGPIMAALDQAMDGGLTRLVQTEEMTGKPGEVTRVLSPAGLMAGQLVVVGLGQRESIDRGAVYRAAGAASKCLATKKRGQVAFCFDDNWPDDLTEAGICAAVVACQGQDLYRADKKLQPFDELSWLGAAASVLVSGDVLGQCLNMTRQLVNEAPSVMTPVRFAEEAAQAANEFGLEIEIWDEQRLAEERCGALLAVARGSDHPPRLVVLKYHGGQAGQPPLALVGKGVTFDSGGLSLKPSDAMKTMKCDMAGAATVVGTLVAAARLKLPHNLVGYAGLVENMVGGDSYKLGDVLASRSGTTIEVLNTDAEGRLVLADVLNVAVERGAGRLIDAATLTGACLVALGTDVAGLMTNDQTWCDELVDASRICGEPVWQLPMFEEFGEQIKSEVADIKNIGEGRWGGAITAAKFLERFVGDTPWIHVDIAGPAFADKPKPWRDAGATGALVRTFVELIRRQV